MKFTFQHPLAHHNYDKEFLKPASVIALAKAAEEAGFSSIAFTDHPVPSHQWLESGGHDSLDPLTALAFCSAVTSRIRLLTYLLVLPYRNPLLAARQAATVDILSGGRLTLAVGSGYLRSEFAALGVDFDERGALFDEAVSAMTGIWATDDFKFTGRHFNAQGQTIRPGVVQKPHPPLWIGGNSRKSRQRVVEFADGWSPLLIDTDLSKTIKTPAISTPEDLRLAVDELMDLAAQANRDPQSIDVQVEGPASVMSTGSSHELRERVATLAEAGATWMVIDLPGLEVQETLERLQWLGKHLVNSTSN